MTFTAVPKRHLRNVNKQKLFKTSARALLSSSFLFGFALQPAMANDWTFEPFIGGSEQYTDNVFGSGSNEESDFVTSVDLGFTLTGETRRTQLNLSYNLSQDFYRDNTHLDGYRQNLVSVGQIELIDDRFFVEGRVTFTEETLSQTGNSSAGDRTLASDRTQVFNGRISPYYVHNFGNWVTGIAKYGYSETLFLESDVGSTGTPPADQRTHEFSLEAISGQRFARFQWQALANLKNSESDEGDSFQHLLTVGSADYPINRLFSIIGTVGHDDFEVDNVDDDAISGFFGGGGIRFHPNSRTDASFQVGHRFGDLIYDLDVSYAPTSRDTISASYQVNVTSADSSLANTDVLDQNDELIRPNFSTAPYLDSVTKSERFSLQWNGSRGRTSYGLSGNFVDRENLEDGSKDKVLSVSGNLSRRLTPRANLSVNGGYTDTIQGGEEETYSFGVDYSYEFGFGLRATAGYDYLHRDESIGEDVSENAFTLSLRKSF